MLSKLKSYFRSEPQKQGAAALPPVVEPKVPNKPQAVQSFSKRTATTVGTQRIMSTDRRTANLDLLTLRNGTSTKSTIHDLAAVSPDLSASVYAYQRMVVTRGFSAVARNLDGTVNADATSLVQQLLARFNYLTDYTQGFSGVSSIHSVAEALALELRLYGSCAMELVLDKARVPNRLQPISTTQIEFWDDGTGSPYALQRINGREIVLDQPTFFYEALDQDLLDAYSSPPMEAALQSVLADTEFTNDVRRVIKRALHPRLDVSIDMEKFKKAIPQDILGDPEKLATFQANYFTAVESTVNGLEPDDALVHSDAVEFGYLNNGNVTLNREYEVLQNMVNAKTATGTKAPPSVLGHGSGSQNVASSESMLFVRYVEGVQTKLNSIFSRVLTLGVRLLGQDVYVQFSFDRVDLRPWSEQSAFRSMQQSIVLEQLSIGMLSDEEACIQLTGNLPPVGAPKLSGTFFKAGSTDPTANPYSNTGATNGGPQDMRPQTPTQPKGPAK